MKENYKAGQQIDAKKVKLVDTWTQTPILAEGARVKVVEYVNEA